MSCNMTEFVTFFPVCYQQRRTQVEKSLSVDLQLAVLFSQNPTNKRWSLFTLAPSPDLVLGLDVRGKVPEPAENDAETRYDEDGRQDRDEEGEVVQWPPPLSHRGQLPSSQATDVGDFALHRLSGQSSRG